MKTRMESDCLGELEIPVRAYYGINALRASRNFPITGRRLHPQMITSLAAVKKAAAMANRETGALPPRLASAISDACDELLGGALWEWFIVDPIQGGAGTSANMNANEVIANRAIELLGGAPGDYRLVHPNDHVNMSQSTNDVFPTAGRLTLLRLLPDALRRLRGLEEALSDKAREFDDVLKVGRTQLQDAVPMRLGQEFGAWAAAVSRGIRRLEEASGELRRVPMGGTAIGTGINADAVYRSRIVPLLCQVSGERLQAADDLVDAIQNPDDLCALSGALKACAVTLSKIANDLRLLSSGPRAGLGEITLPPRQNGSSIMPGKINPVIPEVVSQVAFEIIGADVTVTMACEAGQLELNAFEPVLFDRLFSSTEMLGRAAETFTVHCVSGITANRARCGELLEGGTALAAALCPYIGYQRAAELAKASLETGTPLLELLSREPELGGVTLPLDPYALSVPGGKAARACL